MTKNLFADEIAAGMLSELKPEIVKEASVNLVKAVDYLNTAFDILEDAGLTAQANQILNILSKIGGSSDFAQVAFNKESPFAALMDAGITNKDIMEFSKGNKLAVAKFNKTLRDLGYSEDEIRNLLSKYYMTSQEFEELLSPERSFTKIDNFLKDPLSVRPSAKSLNPGDEFIISTLANDPHTKGLTSEKMVKNLLDHGTEFNMADDGKSDDLLNLDVIDNDLEVSEGENSPEMDFEDEI